MTAVTQNIHTLHVLPGSSFTESMMNVASFVTADVSRTATATAATCRSIKMLLDIFLWIWLEVQPYVVLLRLQTVFEASARETTMNGIRWCFFFYISIASYSNRIILCYQSLSWTLIVWAVAEETIRAKISTS